jgi:hypothetical protein
VEMYFNVTLGPDGTLQLPEAILASRKWSEGSTITVMATVHGVILNERAELERLVASRLAGLDPVAGFIEEMQRELVPGERVNNGERNNVSDFRA